MSQVSPQLCAVARKVIYRKVDLRSDGGAVGTTLELLTRDYSVAQNVRRLHLYTISDAAKNPTWFNIDALAGMANLRQLNLTGIPFYIKEDQLKFNNIVSKSLLALRQLKYFALYSALSTNLARAQVLQISGLQEITWSDPCAYSTLCSQLNGAHRSSSYIRMPVSHPRAPPRVP